MGEKRELSLEEMVRHMLELQLENDKQIHNFKQIDYADIKGRYFYAFLENIGNANYSGKSRWCWWKAVPERKFLRTIQKKDFFFTTSTILSYALALTDGDIDKVMEAFPIQTDTLPEYYKQHNPSKMFITKLMIQFTFPGQTKVEELLKNWLNLAQTYHYDFKKDIYKMYVKNRKEHSYLKPKPKRYQSRINMAKIKPSREWRVIETGSQEMAGTALAGNRMEE